MRPRYGPIESLWRAAGYGSQTAAAQAAGLTTQTLIHWMRGHHLPARLPNVQAAAKAWKTSPQAVLQALHEELVRALPRSRRRRVSPAA